MKDDTRDALPCPDTECEEPSMHFATEAIWCDGCGGSWTPRRLAERYGSRIASLERQLATAQERHAGLEAELGAARSLIGSHEEEFKYQDRVRQNLASQLAEAQEAKGLLEECTELAAQQGEERDDA